MSIGGRSPGDSPSQDEALLTDSYNANTGFNGKGLVGTANSGNRKGYAGYEYDPVLAAFHVRHRVYLPEIGRWARRDPLGYVGGINLSMYTGSAPIRYVDPTGLVATTEWDPSQYEPAPEPPWWQRFEPQSPDQPAYKPTLEDILRPARWQQHCEKLRRQIKNLKDEIDRQYHNIRHNKDLKNLPQSCPGDVLKPEKSVRGHKWLRGFYRLRRNQLIKNYLDNGCGNDDFHYQRRIPVPSAPPLPWRIPLPLLPAFEPDTEDPPIVNPWPRTNPQPVPVPIGPVGPNINPTLNPLLLPLPIEPIWKIAPKLIPIFI